MKHLTLFSVALVLSSWTMQARATHPCAIDAGPCDCCHGPLDCPPGCFDSGAAGAAGSATGGSAGAANGGSGGAATGGSAGAATGGVGGAATGGSAGTAGTASDTEDDGGCGCRVVPRSNEGSLLSVAAAGLWLLRRGRRRASE